MVTGLKAVGDSGFVEVETEDADTIDTNGFSDPISVVSSKTAKFSGGGIMQANGGKKISLLQLSIDTGAATIRTRSVIANANPPGLSIIGNSANAIDGNLSTQTDNIDYNNPVPPVAKGSEQPWITIDFTSIAVSDITAKIFSSIFSGASVEYKLQISTVGGDSPANWTTVDTLLLFAGSPNDQFLSASNQTYRFARVTANVSIAGNGALVGAFEIFELGPGTVTTNIRSSITQDANDGTIILANQILAQSSSIVFDSDVLLIGSGQFVTLEIVSFSDAEMPVSLSSITSVKEE